MAALNALPPTVEPRATQHIAQMIAMIERLIANGHAYVNEGHVLFNVPSMPEYGRLSNRDRKEMIAGARVEVAPYKKDPADFVLWKPSAADQPGWDSPWGRGRPGWHIECSAMSEAHLGETFDIHGGGLDLVFPHHENEIAQSVCAHDGKPFVKVWVHNGFLSVNGEKMSKSLGNFFTVADVLEQAPGEAIRFYMQSAHYRAPFDWTAEGLKQAKQGLDKLYRALLDAGDDVVEEVDPPAAVLEALEDDLNTPLAVAHLYELAKTLNRATMAGEPTADAKADLLAAGHLLGVLHQDPATWLKWTPPNSGASPNAEIDRLVADWDAARKVKDYARADLLRAQLTEMKVSVSASPTGTVWRRAE
jgi:cysteinyl-tRNA synthetase